MKKLHSAAKTLPAEPGPAMHRSYERIHDRQLICEYVGQASVKLTAKTPNATVARIYVEVRKNPVSIEICKPC
jgi:hypothetical protein